MFRTVYNMMEIGLFWLLSSVRDASVSALSPLLSKPILRIVLSFF
jgi:hypothetical protein